MLTCYVQGLKPGAFSSHGSNWIRELVQPAPHRASTSASTLRLGLRLGLTPRLDMICSTVVARMGMGTIASSGSLATQMTPSTLPPRRV